MVENMIKNLRRLDNARIIVASNDEAVVKEIERVFSNFCKEVFYADNSIETIEAIMTNRYDIVIIDTDLKDSDFLQFSMKLASLTVTIAKIVISDSDKDDILKAAVNLGAYAYLLKPLNLKDFELSLIMCLNQAKRSDMIEFREGFYYNIYREQFFNKDSQLIPFTKLEYGLLRLLLDRKGEMIDYKTIEEVVWKGKKMSIFTMRNVVNKIRQKTYYEIIHNYSNKGYKIDEIKT